jgi:hypothetical protein
MDSGPSPKRQLTMRATHPSTTTTSATSTRRATPAPALARRDEFCALVALHANGTATRTWCQPRTGLAPAMATAARTRTVTHAEQRRLQTFRYSSFGTPLPQLAPETAGRVPEPPGPLVENYTNPPPPGAINSTSGALAEPLFGPDFALAAMAATTATAD